MDTANQQGERSSANSFEDPLHAANAREDVRLLAGIAAADAQALAALYERHGPVLYSLLVRMLGNEAEAQEVMQDTFVQIWRNAAEFQAEKSSPLAWMIMIARGRAKDRLRARSRRAARVAAYENERSIAEIEETTGAHLTEQGERAAACRHALTRLPEPQSRALDLAFFRGWTHEEIAAALGEPLGTIKARIRRGLLALREALKDHHG